MTFLPKDQVDESKLLPFEYANVKDSEELLQRRDVGEGVVEINNGHVGKEEQCLETKQSSNETCNSYSRSKEYCIVLQWLTTFRHDDVVEIFKTTHTGISESTNLRQERHGFFDFMGDKGRDAIFKREVGEITCVHQPKECVA